MNTYFKTAILCFFAYSTASICMDATPKKTTSYLSVVESKPALYVNISTDYKILGSSKVELASKILTYLSQDIDACKEHTIYNMFNYGKTNSRDLFSAGLQIAFKTDKKTKVRFERLTSRSNCNDVVAFIASIRYIESAGYNIKITIPEEK